MKRSVLAFAVLTLLLPAQAAAGTQEPQQSLGRAGGLEYMRAKYRQVVTQTGPTATCEPGSPVTGGGGSISGDPQTATLNETYPDPSDDTGWWAEGTSSVGSRTMSVWAICGSKPVAYATGQVAINSFEIFDQERGCVGNDIPIGGGISATGSGISFTFSAPKPGSGSWRVVGENTTNSDTLIDPFAVCSIGYDVRYRTETKTVKKGQAGKAVAACKRREAVLGGGLRTLDGGDPTVEAHTVATRPWDSADKKKVPEDGWLAKIVNESGGKLALSAVAVCKRG